MRRHPQSGITLLEMLIALVMLSISMMAAVYFISASFQGTKHNSDKDFAIQKAIGILEEMKSLVEVNNGQDVTLLDDYDDGITFDPILTIQDGVTDPKHPASGNFQDGHGWRYERQISVQKFASLQANDVRLVNVRIYGYTDGQKSLLAETAGVIRTIADKYPPSQVYDLYLLAMENVPGWWVYMSNLIPFVENAVQDLQARNPGLEFRTHWIRTLAYGRDPEYKPYLNRADDSETDIDWVYFYPGTLPSGSAVSTYYVPDGMRGRVNVDGTDVNGYDATDNPIPYALADHYNHAMRLPDERALFNQRVAFGLEDPDAPTFRLLLEDMYSNPKNYENAIIINVHGELFPFPPIRNYSDPAKDPEGEPYQRVVTHPENLRYANGSNVRLRVYSYLSDPSQSTTTMDEPITILLPELDASTTISVDAISGGTNGLPYVKAPALTVATAGQMWYERQNTAGGVVLKLHNSPLKTPCQGAGCSGGGLATGKRLYGLEYIPTPLPAANFDRELDDAGDMTKNTARWIVTIDGSTVPSNTRLTVETRIDDDMTTGVLFPARNEPTNVSRTYTWVGSDAWAFGDGTKTNPGALPLTERFQFMGDPRHNPYADLKADFDATTAKLGTGYNRYFDDFHNGSGNMATDVNYWPGFGNGVKNNGSSTDDLWEERLEADVNRAYQVVRQAVTRSNSLWTTMTGWSYYYIGLGNEIGYDADNGFPNSIPVSSKPFDGTSGSRYEQSITNASSGGVKYIRENGGTGWWGLNWLGELYPDSDYATWKASGNLATGSGTGTFARVLRGDISTNLPTGTSLRNAERRTEQEGCTTLFSIGTSSSKFHHTGNNGNGDLQGDGQEIAARYNFGIPDSVFINRPFNTNRNGTGDVPDNYIQSTYVGASSLTAVHMADYYDHDSAGLLGSALIGLDGPADDMGFIVVNGIGQTIETGSAFMSRWSMLTLLHSFMVGGLYTGPERIRQVPRIEITQPNEITDLSSPSSINIAWDRSWKRWDATNYTNDYSGSFSESTPLDYVVLYSPDNGASWRYAANDLPADVGERPTGSTPTVSTTSYAWATPGSQFPQGSYLIRVEAHRQDYNLHYAYHQRKIYIKR